MKTYLYAILSCAALSGPVNAQADFETIAHRPAEIKLTISNARSYNGSYLASGLTRFCGNLHLMQEKRIKAFGVEFPLDGEFKIRDVTFDAEKLVSGSSTESFYLSVIVTTADGGKPPALVFRTRQPEYKERGTATLSEKDGTATLTVNAVDSMGRTADLTVVCGPKDKKK